MIVGGNGKKIVVKDGGSEDFTYLDDNRVDPLKEFIGILKVHHLRRLGSLTNQNQRFPILGSFRMNEQLCRRANSVYDYFLFFYIWSESGNTSHIEG